jgi:hypothetical protein
MSLTMLLALTLMYLSTTVHAETGEEGCVNYTDVAWQYERYVEGLGCVIDDISIFCDEYSGGDCRSWDQVLLFYEDASPEIRKIFLLDCAEGSDFAHRVNQSSSEWTAFDYFDADGFLVGHYFSSSQYPYCCDGVETPRLYYGDPYATCIEPTDTGDTDTGDTSKTGPCGCAANSGAAAVLLAACSLLTVRRRRQP